MDTDSSLIETEPAAPTYARQRIASYAGVSSAENKSTLESQAERLTAYCAARGYQVAKVVTVVTVVTVVGSRVNDARANLLALLEEQSSGLIVVEHQDRLTRLGFRSLDTLLKTPGRAGEVVNQAENGAEDLLADLTTSSPHLALGSPTARAEPGARGRPWWARCARWEALGDAG